MKQYLLYIKSLHFLMLVFLGLLGGCNKEGAGCFDKAGELKTVTIDVSAFTRIDVSSNVDVKILTSGSDAVEVTTGENLISGISLQVEDSVLKIENLNSCFWARGYEKPLISIRNSELEGIIQHGYGRIYTTDTLYINDLVLQVEDASGAIDLIVDANSINIVSNNIGPISLVGIVNSIRAVHSWSDGILYAKDLLAQNCKINHNGSNRMELNVLNSVRGSVNSIGNVYLYGQEPATLEIELTDEGRVYEKY